MLLSIRKFLLINLFMAVIIISSLTIVGSYYLAHKDIRRYMDSLLVQATLICQGLINKDVSDEHLDEIQQQLDAIPAQISHFTSQIANNSLKSHYSNRFQFQVWDKNGKVLLHSANAPKDKLYSPEDGFSNQFIDGERWRVFTIHDNQLGIVIVAAEPFVIRDELGNRIARDDLYIMLLTYPISGVLIWFIIGLGLRSIRRVADEIAHRESNYLEPVDLQSVPVEIKPLVNELNKLFYRLNQALEREKRFAADAAHELKTPLAALRTQTQVALRTTHEQERNTALHNLITGVDRCTHVVQQLLTLSRLLPEENTLEDIKKVNLPALAAEIIAQLVPAALEKNIEVALINRKQVIIIEGNAIALGILIRNLVDNAIRYTPNNGKVKIYITMTRNHVNLRVTDNGPGIPPELRGRVFERFYRVLGNQSTGSGLGMAIVQQIALLHKAKVKLATPKNGKGLEVKVMFPKSLSCK
ncbi:MAG: two-component sensor histidine kinase [Gammaproteobacteria bacterium]|jgi:two-component system sensor histidine kinase QseC|nr:two-component sensor histidine kinase [Gammaproteobacteria bacterium]